MRERILIRKRFKALLVLGVCSDGGEVAAFAAPCRETHRQTNLPHRHRRTHRLQHNALSMVGTKRPRSMDLITSEIDDTTTTAHADQPAKPKYSPSLLPDFMQKDPLAVTKQKWLEKSAPPIEEEDTPESRRKNGEMMTMSAISLVLAIGVIYALASSAPDMIQPDEMKESENVVRDLMSEGNIERMEIATRNIVGTVLPNSAEDVIAVSIGEGIAGAIGAFATWLLGLVLNFESDEGFMVAPMTEATEMTGFRAVAAGMMDSGRMGSLASEAIADGDYFLTRAAAQPLLEAVGIPIAFASLASVLIATLPYEAVKLSSQKRRAAMEEEMLLDILLEEEENRLRDMSVVDRVSNRAFEFVQKLYVSSDDNIEEDLAEEETEDTENPQQNNVPALDYVELFADITKWLEYDVLISNYRGILALPNGQMLSAGWESAIFGLLAALSSQLYTDVLYLYSDFGNPIKRDKTISRTIEGWASLYATKCLSAATLFGVYEFVRAPTSRLVSQLVSGGYGGCVGSEDFDLCMDTYLIDNPANAATFQADFRAFAVSTMNWMDNLTWILPLNDQETFASFVRGLAVSSYSVLARVFDM